MNRPLFKKADFILIAAVLLVAAALFLLVPKERGRYAEVYVNGKVVATLDLTKNTTASVTGAPSVTIEVKDGAAAFVASDCPDKVCIHTGFVSVSGQTAVCLPNRVQLRIKGGDDDVNLDAVVY
ncbi:MAG: NusG domain II-containing protein [Oscillospiraceae bacterium]|jgi:hypothetical protein|nr:NusG domain II-containing protein [Oscillospiraceae bacterium]